MSEVDDLPCNALVEMTTDYLEDALPPDERSRVDVHLTQCPGCAEHLSQVRTTIRLLGALPGERLSAPAREAVLQRWRSRQA